MTVITMTMKSTLRNHSRAPENAGGVLTQLIRNSAFREVWTLWMLRHQFRPSNLVPVIYTSCRENGENWSIGVSHLVCRSRRRMGQEQAGLCPTAKRDEEVFRRIEAEQGTTTNIPTPAPLPSSAAGNGPIPNSEHASTRTRTTPVGTTDAPTLTPPKLSEPKLSEPKLIERLIPSI